MESLIAWTDCNKLAIDAVPCVSVPQKPLAATAASYPSIQRLVDGADVNEECDQMPLVSSFSPFASWGCHLASVVDKAARLRKIEEAGAGKRASNSQMSFYESPRKRNGRYQATVIPKTLIDRSLPQVIPKQPKTRKRATRASVSEIRAQSVQTTSMQKTKRGIDIMKSKIIDKLTSILPDSFLKTRPLTAMESKKYKDVAAADKLQVFDCAEIQNALMFLREGPGCQQLRLQLSTLAAASNIVVEKLNEGQVMLAQKLAVVFDLWVNKELVARTGQGSIYKIDVWNLGKSISQWRIAVHNKIMDLAQTESAEYSFPTGLSEEFCDVVIEVVDETLLDGLVSVVEGNGRDRRVHIGLLGKFIAETRQELKDLPPGSSKEFRSGMSFLRRNVVMGIAREDFDLKFDEARIDDAKWVVTITRKLKEDANTLKDKSFKRVAADEEHKDTTQKAQHEVDYSEAEKAVAALLSAPKREKSSYLGNAFSSFATGTQMTSSGNWNCLRKSDLTRLVGEARKDLPSRHKSALCKLESRFDDICHVDSVLGSKQNRGLTESAFEALVGQVAKEHGWDFVASLTLVGKSKQP